MSVLYNKVLLDSDICDYLIDLYLKHEFPVQEYTITNIDNNPNMVYINEILFRPTVKSRFILTDTHQKTTNLVIDSILNKVGHVINTTDIIYQTPIFMRYNKNDYFKLHSDNARYCTETNQNINMFGRLYTMVIYLNSDFTGGELHFPSENITIKPEKGLVIIFPSGDVNNRFEHEVLKIIDGTRYNLTTWLS